MSAVSGNNNFWTRGRVKVACHFPFWERMFYVFFRSRERKFQGTKVPGNESSTHGNFAPGSESTWERKFQLPRPYTPFTSTSVNGLKSYNSNTRIVSTNHDKAVKVLQTLTHIHDTPIEKKKVHCLHRKLI